MPSLDALLQVPGQLSEHVGMAETVLRLHPPSAALLEEAGRHVGVPLATLVAAGPEEELRADRNAALAMITVSCMTYGALAARLPIRVLGIAGHSVGFTSALVMAGALELRAALDVALLVDATIDRWMERSGGEYGMGVVVGLPAAEVAALAERHVVDVACVNAATQLAVSGPRGAVGALLHAARAAGALGVHAMPMSKPMHSRALAEVEGELAAGLERIPLRDPRIALLSHVDGSRIGTAEAARALLATQVARCVGWRDAVRALVALAPAGTPLYECGPGDVLTRLARWIDRGVPARALASVEGWPAHQGVHA